MHLRRSSLPLLLLLALTAIALGALGRPVPAVASAKLAALQTTPASCTLSPTSGPVGTAVKVTCSNFQAGEWVRIYWDSTATTQRTLFLASSTGTGSATFVVPDATAGAHQVIAQGATSAQQASQNYTVDSSLTLSSTSGKVGAFVTVTLKGYGAGETVNLTWDGAPLKSVTTSTTGTASTWFTAPEAVTGNHTVTGTSVTSREAA